jgi:hypothetical protein
MGAADIATVLFSRYLTFDPKKPAGLIATALCCPPATVRC